MKLQLIHFLSTDHLKLPGLLYEPEKPTKEVAIYLHGNGSASVVYSPSTNIIAEHLTEKGIAYFPFNNRGAHYIKSLKKITSGETERVKYGTAYEVIKDCIKDIDGAIEFLKTRGYTTFYLIGESTGANKIVVYDYYKKKNLVSKYILLSGGDDSGLFYEEVGADRFDEILEEAEDKIEEGRGIDLVPSDISPYPLSYQSLFDTINPEGDYNIFPFNDYINDLGLSEKPPFKELHGIDKPTLVIYGEKDEFCYGDVPECIETLKKHVSDINKFRFTMLLDADHGFHGKEKELARAITEWLAPVNLE